MKLVEGVPYYRFSIRFRTVDGQRVRWTRWSPGMPWLRDEVSRELQDRGIEPRRIRGRVTIEHAP